MSIESLLPFIKEIDRLKNIERQTLNHNGGRRENSAEHSWHLALSVLICEKYAPTKIDINKAIKMALLHDIVEIDAGDTIVYGHQPDKKNLEEKALKRLLGLLPADLNQELTAIWTEFEEGQSAEAQFVAALDRFLPLYSNYLNEGYSWKNHQINTDKIVAKCEPPISKGIPALWELTKTLLKESLQKGHLKN